MFVLIVILVVSLGFLLAMVGHRRHSNDPMHEHEQAFATLRRIVESPRVQLNELAERIPVASGHVRILSERPAGLPRSRRKRPRRRARTATPRRRPLTAHPKIAISPLARSVPSSPDTTKANNSRGRDIEVRDYSANGSDRGRGSANVASTATRVGPTGDDAVRMTLVPDEAERRKDAIANSDPNPRSDEFRADGSRLKRRPGGSQDALTAAIERAISHIDGTTGYTPLTNEPIPALFGVPRQSA